MWSAIFIDRTAVGLDAYVRLPFIEGIVASFRGALPLPQTCAIHPEKNVQVFCPACDKSACNKCWTWVAYYCFRLSLHIHCFVKVSCPILCSEYDVPVILLNNGIRLFFSLPSDQHSDHVVTAVPLHTYAQYANSVVNYNNAMHSRTD